MKLVRPEEQVMDIIHYDLHLDLPEGRGEFQGAVVLQARILKDRTARVVLHARGLDIRSVALERGGEKPLAYMVRGDRMIISLKEPLAKGQEIIIRVSYRGQVGEGISQGLFLLPQGQGGLKRAALFTQHEPQGARMLFPCFDEPFDKATTAVTLTGPEGWTLLSNGAPVGEREMVKGGRQRVSFLNPDPIPPYLLTVVAAPLQARELGYVAPDGRRVPLTIWHHPGCERDIEGAAAFLPQAMGALEAELGLPYPWASYGVVVIDRFPGGMENKGLANLSSDSIYHDPALDPLPRVMQMEGLIVHELAHEWLGNLVTLRYWDDLWLNEALADYATVRVMRRLHGEGAQIIQQHLAVEKRVFKRDRGPLAHAVAPDLEQMASIESLFDAITYTKGRAILGMLEVKIGAEAFRAGLISYLRDHGRSNATRQDLLLAMERASGVDLEGWARAWLNQAGHPVVEAQGVWQGGKAFLTLTQASSGPARDAFPLRIPVGFLGEGGVEERVIELNASEAKVVLAVDQEPKAMGFNRRFEALAEVNQPSQGPVHWLAQVRGDTDPFSRYMAARLALGRWVERAKAGEAPETELVEALSAALRDRDVGVRLGILRVVQVLEVPVEVLRSLAGALAEDLLEASRGGEGDPLVVSAARQDALEILALAGTAEADRAVTEALASADPSRRLGALAGGLRARREGRFADFMAQIEGARGVPRRVSHLIYLLASSRDPEAMAPLLQVLSDPETVDPADDSPFLMAFRGLKNNARNLLYSPEGLAFMERLLSRVGQHRMLASQVVGTFEDLAERPAEEQGRIGALLGRLLASPALDPEVKAIIRRIQGG